MRISLISDVHLEFGNCFVANTDNAQVLVLAGDICVASSFTRTSDKTSAERYHQFFSMVSRQFRHVIYVMGNHEHYRGDFATSANILREQFQRYDNIVLLDKEHVVIEDIVFVGGTLWTDYDRENPNAMTIAKSAMSDYRVIENTNSIINYRAIDYAAMGTTAEEYHSTKTLTDDVPKPPIMCFKQRSGNFSVDDALEDHKATLEAISKVCEQYSDHKVVVVGHHAPSSLSVKPQYIGQSTNPAYYSDLSEFILDRPNIVYWMHGHMHDQSDYTIGDTRVLCNPRGYIGYEVFDENATYFTVEI